MNEEYALLQKAARRCFDDVISTSPPDDGGVYCASVWDGWGCWNYTPAGSRAYISCPSYKTGFDPRLSAYRDCNDDGTWWRSPQNRTWSNYTACVNIAELSKNTRLIYIYVTGYSISILALLTSIIIFTIFRRQLHCDRVTLHKHLFTSYILSALSWICYYTQAALDATVIADNPAWCRALHVVTQYLVSCNFMWMFCEGFYLHTIIVRAFTSGNRLLLACFVIGWSLPLITTTLYTVVRANLQSESDGYWLKESRSQWIVSGPILATLLVNFCFLCNIVRVLVTKLRAVNSPDTEQTKKAVRATLILIPLLGLQYMLFPMRPREGSTLDDVYLITVAIVTSLQGVFVAVLFCFLNGEVLSVLRRRWTQRLSLSGVNAAYTTTAFVGHQGNAGPVNQPGTVTTLLTPGGWSGDQNTAFASSPNTSTTLTNVLLTDCTNFYTENTPSSASAAGGGGGSKRHYQMNSTLSATAAMQPLCLHVNDDSVAEDTDVVPI